MVFSGHVLVFLFTQVFYIFVLGMLSLLMGWTASNPGIASSRMILFIPGGFILGGPTGPVPVLSDWVQLLSHVFPLTWEFHFVRDIITDCQTRRGCAFLGFQLGNSILCGISSPAALDWLIFPGNLVDFCSISES